MRHFQRSRTAQMTCLLVLIAAVILTSCSTPFASSAPKSSTSATQLTTVYVDDPGLAALNARNGSLKWRIALNVNTVNVDTLPLAWFGSTLYTSNQTNMCAINATNGAKQWCSVDFSVGYPEFGGFLSEPIVSFDSVYFAAPVESEQQGAQGAYDSGFIYALNRSNGSLRWKRSVNFALDTVALNKAPLVYDSENILFVGAIDGVYALRATDGAVLWHVQTRGHIAQGMTLVGNTLYFVSSGFHDYKVTPDYTDGSVYAVNVNNGAVLWRVSTSADGQQPPVFANNVLYVGVSDGSVAAYNASNGALRWRYLVPDITPIPQSGYWGKTPTIIAAAGEIVYISTPSLGNDPASDIVLDAVNAANGNQIWRHSGAVSDPLSYIPNVYVTNTPTFAPATKEIIVNDPDGYLDALDMSTGATLWRYQSAPSPFEQGQTYHPNFGAVIPIADEIVGFVNDDWNQNGYLVALNNQTGKEIWKYSCGDGVCFGSPEFQAGP